MVGKNEIKHKRMPMDDVEHDMKVVYADSDRTKNCRIILAVLVMFSLVAVAILVPVIILGKAKPESILLMQNKRCDDPCTISLVESIPENLTYPAGSPSHPSTFSALMRLVEEAEDTIEIASFYWTLRGQDVIPDPSDWEGEELFQALMTAGRDRHIQLKIAQNQPNPSLPNNDTLDLQQKAGAIVRSLNFTAIMGAGILHTKMWIADRQHFYLGSANLDWRSLTQVKELGFFVRNCSCLAEDMAKIFDVYWYLGKTEKLPEHWPMNLSTPYNNTNPMAIKFNETAVTTYLSSSPPPFCPDGRTSDVDAIIDVIRHAKKFIYIAVMDYIPALLYSYPMKYWPLINDALKTAALDRNVTVHLMGSYWEHTRDSIIVFLKSLQELDKFKKIHIEVKLFVVPATEKQKKIPYARVNHNKYMVTDQTAYVGTSNWSGDYFVDTGGIGFIVNQNSTSTENNIRQQLEDVFNRDWNSMYAHSLTYNFTKH